MFMWLKHKNSIKKGQSNLKNKSNGQIKKITLNYEFLLTIFLISCGTPASRPCLGYRTYSQFHEYYNM